MSLVEKVRHKLLVVYSPLQLFSLFSQQVFSLSNQYNHLHLSFFDLSSVSQKNWSCFLHDVCNIVAVYTVGSKSMRWESGLSLYMKDSCCNTHFK